VNKKLIRKIGIIASLVVMAAVLLFACGSRRNSTANTAEYQTVVVETGNLVHTIDAIGQMRASQSATLLWETTGSVENVLVVEGDEVIAGDVLATLNQASLPQNIILAQADYLNAIEALDNLSDEYSGLAIAEAAKQILDAQEELDDAEYDDNTLTTPARSTDLDQAYADVVVTKESYDEALDEFEPYEYKLVEDVERARRLAAVADAQEIYESALRTYNYLNGNATDFKLSQSQADIGLAQEKLLDAQQEHERLVAGPTESEIAAANAKIAAALANLNQASIDAPFDGTVTLVDMQIGDLVSNNQAAVQLDNLDHLYIDINVNEIDIVNVKVEQSATIRFDAINGVNYEGVVVKAGLNGDDSSGVVNYTVTVEVLGADNRVRTGMTAEVNIVVNESGSALLVPNEAVRLVDGEQVIYSLGSSGQLNPITIQLGSSSGTHSVVLSGDLKAGDEIVLNPTQTQLDNVFGPGSEGDDAPPHRPFGGRE